LELVGGVVGIGYEIWWLLATPFNALTLILAPIPISIYILSLVAGVALWRGNSFGRKASIVVQAIQLPKIVSPLIIFMFSFGFDLWVHILPTRRFSNLGFEFRFLAFNQFFFNVQDAPCGLGVSITACIFLAALLRHKPGRVEDAAILPPLPPTTEPPKALAFQSRLDFDALYDRLNEVGPWQWRGTDSDTYGAYLSSRPQSGVTLRIFGDKPDWVIQISRRDDAAMSRDEIDRVLAGQIFPAIRARNIRPTDTVY